MRPNRPDPNPQPCDIGIFLTCNFAPDDADTGAAPARSLQVRDLDPVGAQAQAQEPHVVQPAHQRLLETRTIAP